MWQVPIEQIPLEKANKVRVDTITKWSFHKVLTGRMTKTFCQITIAVLHLFPSTAGESMLWQSYAAPPLTFGGWHRSWTEEQIPLENKIMKAGPTM